MKALQGIIIDLDGTVCRGEEIIPGAPKAIEALRRRGIHIVFVSNTIDSPSTYASRLTRHKVLTNPEDIIQTAIVLRHYLLREIPNATVFVIGEEPLLEELRPWFKLSEDPKEIDVVVASFDRGFNYHKLNIGFQALKRGARFLATNIDATCPLPEGEIPDAAPVIAALEACTGRKLDLNIGKPSTWMLEIALERLGLSTDQTLLVGDRVETDILMGKRAGMVTVLVLTGVTRRKDLDHSPVQPDYILESIVDLPQLLDKGLGAGSRQEH